MAVDAAQVYWANETAFSRTGAQISTIGRANLDGTHIDRNFIRGANNPCGVAVDATHIYWANLGVGETGTTIGRAKLDGTGVNASFITHAVSPCGEAVR